MPNQNVNASVQFKDDSLFDTSNGTRDTRGLGGHPRGLTTLFFTEMWERFSYYGMRGILILYMVAPVAEGGLGFDSVRATSIYGTYTMAVYLTALPGGFIADKFLGLRRSVLIGGIIIALGHFTLAFRELSFFYAGLALIVIGTGFLKPNISGLVGNLYAENDARRDSGFSIFYMGINIGAFIAPLVCGYFAQSHSFKSFLAANNLDARHSWHYGFAAAGIGMTIGLIQFIAYRAQLVERTTPQVSKESLHITKAQHATENLRHQEENLRHQESASREAVSDDKNLSAQATDPQANNRQRLYAKTPAINNNNANDHTTQPSRYQTEDRTNRGHGSLPVGQPKLTATEWKRLTAIFIFFLFITLFWSIYEQAGSSLNLFADRLTRTEALGFAFPSSWFQAVPALFVIALAPLFSALWLRLGARQPSAPAKFTLGLIALGGGTLLMIPASLLAANARVSPVWLLGVYFLHVVGEMCLSPVGLSTVTKLAPVKLVGLMLGVWFLASALGNKIAGALAGLFNEKDTDLLIKLFGGMTLAAFFAAAVLALLTPAIRRLMSGVK